MLRYSHESKAYRLFDLKAQKVIICRDVRFNENISMGKQNENVIDL